MKPITEENKQLAAKLAKVVIQETGEASFKAVNKVIDSLPIILGYMISYSIGDVCDIAEMVKGDQDHE